MNPWRHIYFPFSYKPKFRGNILNGDQFKLNFSQPGTYKYHCNIHPSMKGVVIVTSAQPTIMPAITKPNATQLTMKQPSMASMPALMLLVPTGHIQTPNAGGYIVSFGLPSK